ncbi:MAG: phosphoglucosamine mutase [Candidatus Ancaeobacter aquaticus]|nr:phosphoglucosamine mutase [Candidatus Ancaeobacter aquaticus]
MKKLFGTDGVRGIANTEPMTAETVLKIGRAAAYIFKKDNTRRHRIIIGKDTRVSGYMIESALVSGICSMGVDVVQVGPLPTPGIAFITRSLRADAGIVISASHNPYEDNGIKLFSSDGYKLPESIERKIEELIATGEIDSIRPTATDIGKAYRDKDAIGRYVEFIKNSFPKGLTLDGISVVLDCANGAGYKIAPKVLTELGADVKILNDAPNGTNINLDCGAIHTDVIRKAVIGHKVDVGISLDGDADRVIFADENGNEVDGDLILAICALDMKRNKALQDNAFVTTVMNNMGLDIAMEKAGIKLYKANVGDRYVIAEMEKRNLNLGGEQSGHIIFKDYTTTGDGMITALQVLRIMKTKKMTLSALCSCMQKLPQILMNIKVKSKKPFESVPDIKKEMETTTKELGNKGRLLLRYSGTQNIARIMLEGEDIESINTMAERLAVLIKTNLG